jgi:hypothetical protein
MFEDIVQRGKHQARQPFGLTPGQSSELQRAAAIIESVEECCADERLSYAFNNILDFLHRVVRRAELARLRAAKHRR